MSVAGNPQHTNTLADYVALEYILLGDPRDLLEETPDTQTTKWIIAVLDALLETLPCEMRLKSRGGYLQEVREQFPSWSNQIGLLETEKNHLFAKLSELRRQIHSPASFETLALELRYDLQEWMTLWTAHLRHERRLMQNAFNVDVGCGD